MATVTLSPTAIPLSTMSTRRTPLSSNPNAANSPLRGAAASAFLKAKRSHATVQREEAYGQPPPLKKQIIDHSRVSKSQATATRPVARPTVRERAVQPAVQPLNRYNDKEQEDIEAWTRHHRARFPKIVFYFESVPDEVRSKLAKQVASLGAREEKFFSINITHVITTRSIPPAERGREESAETSHEEPDPEPEEQPQTINPSLLDRSSDARRRYLLDPTSRRAPSHAQDDAARRSKPARNTDVLSKAREMGKKIWALEKLQRMLQILLEDGHAATVGYVARAGQGQSRKVQPYRNGEDLQQLLQKERLNGPSDRDPTVVSKELHFFKGPYIYIYDIDEKQKPIMVREYAKVSNKHDGEWPQFRSVANGRCPFVEEPDHVEKESRKQQREQRAQAKQAKEKEKAAKSLAQNPVLQPPPEIPPPKPVTGKRTLAEMEDGVNRGRAVLKAENAAESSVPFASKHVVYPLQNAFTSRHGHGRLFAGEPVASGVQPSNITSAIRSTMISSTSGLNGAKAGTSKELHGLQRKVLQKSAPGSHELSSRRLTELSLENPSSRSISMTSRTASRRMETVDEDPKTHKAVATQAPPKKSKAEMKPGYCENCGDKFDDFDDHIVSRKHRRFAENNDNWHELDSLLQQLARVPKNWTPEEW